MNLSNTDMILLCHMSEAIMRLPLSFFSPYLFITVVILRAAEKKVFKELDLLEKKNILKYLELNFFFGDISHELKINYERTCKRNRKYLSGITEIGREKMRG